MAIVLIGIQRPRPSLIITCKVKLLTVQGKFEHSIVPVKHYDCLTFWPRSTADCVRHDSHGPSLCSSGRIAMQSCFKADSSSDQRSS